MCCCCSVGLPQSCISFFISLIAHCVSSKQASVYFWACESDESGIRSWIGEIESICQSAFAWIALAANLITRGRFSFTVQQEAMFTRHARCPCRCFREDEYTPNSVRSLLTIIHCDNDAAFRDFIINFEKHLVKILRTTTSQQQQHCRERSSKKIICVFRWICDGDYFLKLDGALHVIFSSLCY